MADFKRAARVAPRVHKELMMALQRDIRDPRVQGVVVVKVDMPDDLQLATVRIRLEMGGDDPARKKAAMAGLRAASGRLRRTVGANVGLRYTPELRFVFDEGVDHEGRVEELLMEIEKERKGSLRVSA
jgi:ribosome-binding factor A